MFVGVVEELGGYEGGHLQVVVGHSIESVLDQIWYYFTHEDKVNTLTIMDDCGVEKMVVTRDQFMTHPWGYLEGLETKWLVHEVEPGRIKEFFPM